MATNDELVLKLKADIESFKKDLNTVKTRLDGVEKKGKKTTDSLSKQFKQAGQMIQTYFFGRIAMGMKRILDDHSKLITQMNVLKQTGRFDVIADQFKNLEAATGGLVNKMELLPSINRAMAFGIDLSKGRLQKLVEMAQKTSLVMGTDLVSAFDDLIVGVARESRLILDNLGVVISTEKATKKYAATLGKTAKELTKTERQTAILNEALKQMEKSTKGVDIEKALSAWEKMSSRIAKNFSQAADLFAVIVNNVLDTAEDVGESVADMSTTAMQIQVNNAKKLEAELIKLGRIKKEDYSTEIGYLAALRAEMDRYNKEKAYSKFINDSLRLSQKLNNRVVIETRNEYVKFFNKIRKEASKTTTLFTNMWNTFSKAGQSAQKDALRDQLKRQERYIQDRKTLAQKLAKIERGGVKTLEDFIKAGMGREEYKKYLQDIEKRTTSVIKSHLKNVDIKNKIIDANAKNIEQSLIQAKLEEIAISRQEELAKIEQDNLTKKQKALTDIFNITKKIGEQTGIEAKNIISENQAKQIKNNFSEIANIASGIGTQDALLKNAEQFLDVNEDTLKYISDDWKKFGNSVSNVVGIMGNQVTSTFDYMYQQMIEGNEINTQEMLKNFLLQGGAALVTDGAVNMWKGAGKTLFGDPSGPALLGLGAAEMAAGYGMGYLGKGIQTPAGGDAGGGAREAAREDSSRPINIQIQSSIYGSKQEAVNVIGGLAQTSFRQKGII